MLGVELVGQRRASEQDGCVLLADLQQHGDQAGLVDLHDARLHRPADRQLDTVVAHDGAALFGRVVEVLQILDVRGRFGQTFDVGDSPNP